MPSTIRFLPTSLGIMLTTGVLIAVLFRLLAVNEAVAGGVALVLALGFGALLLAAYQFQQSTRRREQEYQEIEQELRRSETRFHRFWEHAADAFFLHDDQGRFVDVNQQACTSLGYTREELLTMSVSDVEVGFDPDKLRLVWHDLEMGRHVTLAGQHRRKDGTEFPVEVRLALIEPGRGGGLFALVRDVTERKRLETELAEKAKIEGVILAGRTVQHELNNALVPTLFCAEELACSPQLSPELRATAEQAREGAERCAKLIGGLLRLTEVQEKAWAPGINATLDVDGMARPAAEPEHSSQPVSPELAASRSTTPNPGPA